MYVKICGVTTPEDAVQAAQLGATHIGLNFYPPSPRYLSAERATAISRDLHTLPNRPIMVGIFVNESVATIRQIMAAYGLDLAQLSGDEQDEKTFERLGARAFRSYRLKNGASFDPACTRKAPSLLLDAYVEGAYGGTGKTTDWARAAHVARRCDLLLAGGLTPDNVADAIRRVQPWGVDVASGVESAPGVKDLDELRAFIENASSAYERNANATP